MPTPPPFLVNPSWMMEWISSWSHITNNFLVWNITNQPSLCSVLGHRSLPPGFESRYGFTWRLFHLWFRFIIFGCPSAHLAYHLHKSGRKTPTIIIIIIISIMRRASRSISLIKSDISSDLLQIDLQFINCLYLNFNEYVISLVVVVVFKYFRWHKHIFDYFLTFRIHWRRLILQCVSPNYKQ